MNKIFKKYLEKYFVFFFLFTLFFGNLPYVYATETSSVFKTDNKNLTSTDLLFIHDFLKTCNFKDVSQDLRHEIVNFQKFEKDNKDLIKNGNYNCNLLFKGGGGSSSGGGASREFYLNNYEDIYDFKLLVKEYMIRKSVNENTLNKLINEKILMDNQKFYEKFKKWGNKILENYSINENQNLANYKKFTLKDIDIYYLKQEIEYLNFDDLDNTMKYIVKRDVDVWSDDYSFPGKELAWSPRIIFASPEIRHCFFGQGVNKDYEKALGKSAYTDWTIEWAMQNKQGFQANDEYFNKLEYGFYRGSNQFLMFGSNKVGDPGQILKYFDIKSERPQEGSYAPYTAIFYHKFLIKLPDGKFKISYIVDFDGNGVYSYTEPSTMGQNTRTHFQEAFSMLLNKKSDLLYKYFLEHNFYDYDYNDGQLNNDININDMMKPYNINCLNNKDLINKLNNIEDLLNYLRNNLNYDKYFDDINKKLDNYDALLLNLDDKMNFIIDQLKNQKLFDYNKLNDLIKKNLEDFNNKYIENLKLNLNEIKNLIKENKIEILKNQNKIVDVYDTVLKVDRINNSLLSEVGNIKSDLEYIKSNLKSPGQIESDDDFKKSFFDKSDGKNRIEDSLNFFDKFIKFFKDFFTITEEFNFKKIDTTNLHKKVPFSLFYDFSSIFKSLIAPPKVPVFEFPVYTEKFTIDFSKFESLAVIVRTFTLINFLIFIVMTLYKKVG